MERPSPVSSSATSGSKKTQANRGFLERKDETFLSFFYFQHKKHIVQKLSITLFEQVHNPQNCPSKSCPNFGKEIIAFL